MGWSSSYNVQKIRKHSRKNYGNPINWDAESKKRNIDIQRERRNKYNAIDLIVEMEYGKFH